MRNQTFSTIRHAILMIAMILPLSGCSETTEDISRMSPRAKADAISKHYDATTIATIRPVANRVFRETFPVNRDLSEPNLWVSSPIELTDEDKRAAPLKVRTAPRHRRVAELELLPDATGVIVRCHVRIERLDTLAREAFAGQRGDDRPTQTPIDKQHGNRPQTSDDWIFVARDRKLEQKLLSAITADIEGIDIKATDLKATDAEGTTP